MTNNIPEIYGKLETSENNSIWVAVRTKPRHEKKIARKCIDLKLPYYLPLKDSVREYKDRIKTYRKPLFPGYIFCRLSPAEQRKLSSIGSVLTYLIPTQQEVLVNELIQLYNFHNLGASFEEHKFLKRGKRVRILRGTFADYEGKVSNRKGKYRVVLNISLINQAVAIEVDAKDIAILDDLDD